MARVNERIAIGIGPQANRETVLSAVRDATELVTTGATGTDATGILLRDPGDLSMSFESIRSEGGVVPGSNSRLPGSFQRITPSFSFTIDARGNGVATDGGGPLSGDFNFDEYFVRILEGARLSEGSLTSSASPYVFVPATSQEYQSIKVWRGDAESWTFVGCTMDLEWSFTSGEKATIVVTVFSDSVIYNASDTFPPTVASTAYGTQLDASPVLQLAGASLDGDTRGFQSGTLGIIYDRVDFLDANVTNGLDSEQADRTVNFSADWILDTAQSQDDFDQLSAPFLSGSASPQLQAIFTLGQAAGAGDIANAQQFDIPNWEISTHDKVDQTKVVRTLTGVAVIAGGSGDGSAANEEFVLSGV